MKVILRFFKCMESMARDMRHPYIPSTTVLGDNRQTYYDSYVSVKNYGKLG